MDTEGCLGSDTGSCLAGRENYKMTSECCSNHVSDSNGNVMVFSLSSFITKFLSFFVYNYFLLAARIRNGFLAQNFSLSHHFFFSCHVPKFTFLHITMYIQVPSSHHDWLDPSLQLRVPMVDVDKVFGYLVVEANFTSFATFIW